jgi:hypothetical protein
MMVSCEFSAVSTGSASPYHPTTYRSLQKGCKIAYADSPQSPLGTSRGLSSAFLAFQAGVEQRAVFEHGAGDVEKTVADGPESAGMGTAAGFQSKILGFTFLIAPPRGVRQVVNGVPQSWIAGEPAGDGAAFARLAGDRGHTALEKA